MSHREIYNVANEPVLATFDTVRCDGCRSLGGLAMKVLAFVSVFLSVVLATGG